MTESHARTEPPVNRPRQVLFASLIGTTIEFFDFYIYATAAVLVFPELVLSGVRSGFRHAGLAGDVWHRVSGAADRLGALRPLRRPHRPQDDAGASRSRRWGCPRWRSAPCRPTARIGFAAPLLLALCRFGQGLGLGGEWGGAVLLAIENAPPGKRAWYGMFPQLGAPIGFFLSGGVFLLLSRWLTDEQFFAFGWRLPFLASAVLVFLGLYVRLTITRRPCSRKRSSGGEQVKVPMLVVFRDHAETLVAGILACARDVRALLPDDGLRAVVGHDARSASAARSSC